MSSRASSRDGSDPANTGASVRRRALGLVVAAAFACTSTRAAREAGEGRARELRERWPSAPALVVEGFAERDGARVPMRLETGPNGSFALTLEGVEELVHDGRTLWARGIGEPPLPVGFDRRERLLARVWLWSGQAFEGQRVTAHAWDGEEGPLELRLTGGRWRAELTRNADGDALEWRTIGGDSEERGRLDDWRPVADGQFPQRAEFARADGASYTLVAERVESRERRAAALDARPSDDTGRAASPTDRADVRAPSTNDESGARLDATSEPTNDVDPRESEPLAPIRRPPPTPLASSWLLEHEARVPLRRSDSGHLLVEVHRTEEDGGASLGTFVLDSGAGLCCLDPRVANELELTALGDTSIEAVAGSLDAAIVAGPALRVGPLLLPAARVWTPSLEALEEIIGEPLAGILGFPLFAHARVRVDAVGGTLELRPGGAPAPANSAPLLFDGRSSFVRARLERSPLWLRLDTGSSDTLTLHAGTVERLALLDGDPHTRFVRLSGLDGHRSALRVSVHDFELAGHGLRRLPATFLGPGDGALDENSSDGNLGLGVLARAPFVIDYAGAWFAWE